MNFNLKDFKLYCFDIEYNKYNKLLNRLQSHIQLLYKQNIIYINEYNIRLSDIYKIINTLNNNGHILDDCSDDDYIFSDFIIKLGILNTNYKNIYEYLCLLYKIPNNQNLLINDKILFPLKFINQNIKDLMENIGSKKLNDIFIVYNLNDILLNDERELFNLYNNIFTPIRIEIVDNIIYTPNDLKIIQNNSDFFTKKIYIKHARDNENEELLDNKFNMYLNLGNKSFKICGFFKLDSLQINIRLMNISMYNKIFQKKKQIEDILHKSDIFKHKYLKYCSIQEIIVYPIANFIEYLNTIHNKFNEINNKSFPSLMKIFIGKNNKLFDWYETIKLLLFGSDDNVIVAGTLFSLLKDKKINFYSVSDIIYDNLVFCNQIKLKKINQTLKIELDKLNELNFDTIDHKKKLASCTHIPLYIRSLTLEKINEMKLNNNDYNKQLTYVKTILQFPWTMHNDDNIFNKLHVSKNEARKFINDFDINFNKITYGHENVKQQISLILTRLISNPNSTGTSIGLVGPPGVGKTLIATSLSKILDIPMIMITLGGQNDAELLIGHGYTYSGSQPGLIIRKMCEVNNNRCIMYFDELDKTGLKHGSINEITNILIHLTDPNTNKSFQDRFFQGIDFPLDKIIVIASYNDSSKIDKVLLDRLIEIEVKPYNIDDKIKILKNFIIDELKENIGLTNNIIFNEIDMKKFIYEYTAEAGIRDLKHKIEQVLLNINKNILLDDEIHNDIELDYSILSKYIENTKKNHQKIISTIDQIGYVNGLYATSIGGGGITSIEICPIFIGQDFQLKLTGSMGDIMKESVQVALTQACNYICNNTQKYNIMDIDKYIKEHFKFGFHLHTPEGATPKDGPSAGVAFTIGFISIIIQKPINHSIALTGEMNLSGDITKIGGLIYKLIGAKNAGVKTVLIPYENKIEIEDIIQKYYDLFNDDFKYHYINNISDVVNYMIIN